MNLDALLQALAEDHHRPALRAHTKLRLAALGGFLVSAALVVTLGGLRKDWSHAVLAGDVQVKTAAAVTLLVTGFIAMREALQPTALPRWSLRLLWLAPLLAFVAVGAELATLPAVRWRDALWGTHPEMCVMLVPLLSIPALLGSLFVMRDGAPRSPTQAGAVAGLANGAVGAGAYMLHCNDDAPLFLMTWYGAAVLAVAGLGAVLGRRMLRW